MALTIKNSIDDWLEYINSIHMKNFDLTLDRVFQVANRLNLLKCFSFVFSITGTNGKGSTSVVIENILISLGYKVGLYTSPHLITYSERIRINGSILNDLEHVESFIEIEKVRKGVLLTYFEYSFLSSLWLFKKKKVDVLVLEVGIGGRLDAINIIDSDISIITNIGIDHKNLLGNTRDCIGYEKACLFRKSKIGIIGETKIPKSVYDMAKKKNTFLKRIKYEWDFKKYASYWNFFCELTTIKNINFSSIITSNIAIALSALVYSNFNIDKKIINQCLQDLYLPGRFQIFSIFPLIILDVGHNVHSASYISKKLICIKKKRKRKVYIIIGMVEYKDIKGVIKEFLDVVDCWIFVQLNSKRSLKKKNIKRYMPEEKSFYFDAIGKAWKYINSKIDRKDILLIFGSFITVFEFLSLLKNRKNLNNML